MTGISELRPLGSSALTVRRLRVLIGTVGAVLVMVAALIFLMSVAAPSRWLWVLPAAAAVIGGVAWWWAGVDYARWAWRLTEDLFEVRRGVLFRRQHLVPRSRIQNVTTKGGPLQRRFGVLTLAVHTAGTRTQNVEVRDIDARHAEELRRQLGLT
ncbi:MAG TPA: PH domain-containing protein [Acidimicrobiia bacterium]|nr:PH domain-containing protein [Acidimicrobiia bacterium]